MAAGTPQSGSEKNVLTAIEPVLQAFIRPWGRQGEYTYCTVNTREAHDASLRVIFNIAVNEEEQRIYLLNGDSVCVVSAVGGLQGVDQTMRIKSMEVPGLAAEIDDKWLRDMTEKEPDKQLFWVNEPPLNQLAFNATNSVFVRPKVNCRTFVIRAKKEASTMLVTYRGEIRISAWKKIILLMGMVKLYYCGYKMNQHPMPNGILAFMPPGVPSVPSIDSLQDINNVILRISCRDQYNHTIFEILNAMDHRLWLVAFVAKDKPQQGYKQFSFKNLFGLNCFTAINDKSISKMAVFDHFGQKIGAISSNNYTLEDENGTRMFYFKPINRLPESDPRYECRGLVELLGGTLVVQSYVDELRLVRINNLSALNNKCKAAALVYILFHYIYFSQSWSGIVYPGIDQYRFRPHKS